MRVSIDSKIQLFDQRSYEKRLLKRVFFLGESVLLELKTEHGDEKELSALIATCPLRPSRHSNYVLGVRTLFWN